MAAMKSYTDIEQSKKLAEILPIESADMIWYGIYCGMDGQYHLLCDEYNKIGTIAINKEFCKTLFKIGDEYVDWLPCWSLSALLSVLPKKYYPIKDHETNLILGEPKDKWCVLYWDTTGMQHGEETLGDNPIDACYEMILKLHEIEYKEHVNKIKNVPLCTQADNTTFVLEKIDNLNDETNAPTAYGKYVDECLNEATKHFFSKGEDKYSVADLFYAGVRCGKNWFEKQREQKSYDYENTNIQQKDFAPKQKPNFKVGDWISHNTANFVFQVVSLGPCGYEVINRDNYTKAVSFDNEGNYHLWTIKDAKDGDVLVFETDETEWVLIYKKIVTSSSEVPHDLLGYYSLLADNYCNLEGVCAMVTDDYEEYLKPATKEQRDLLFQKMKEAGYEWDAEKKELK